MRASAVVVSYRRQDHLHEVLQGWAGQTAVGKVILCDCSAEGYDPARAGCEIEVVRCRPDPGSRIRHAVAAYAPGDLVFKGDDDIVPLPGLAEAFYRAFEAKGPGIFGVHGRKFLGPRYYGQTSMVGQGSTKVLTEVDFVGVMTASSRHFLGMDLEGCRSEIEDLWWQMKCFPTAKKWVVPTQGLVRHLQSSFDQGRLCASRPARVIRQAFYAEWYQKNYRGAL